MELPIVFTAITLLAVLTALAINRFPPDLILLASACALLITGILSPAEALAGLSNQGMVTVGVLYVVVAGLRDTGAVDWLSQTMLGQPRSLRGAQMRLMWPAAAMSAFINNTPVVAMFTSAVQDWSKRNRFPLSKLLIPLSYASILGGTCTLIGTSTNLVINGLLQTQTDHPGLHLFDLAWVGVPLLVVGLFYILTLGSRLLPLRASTTERFDNVREYTIEMLVGEDCPLIGQSIEQAGLRKLPGLYLVEIDRDGHILPAVSPTQTLQANDRLIFTGAVDSVIDLRRVKGLYMAPDQVFKLGVRPGDRSLIEAVVSPYNAAVNQTIRQSRFRTRYNAAVIAVARNGERLQGKVGDLVLRPGDTLLLESDNGFVQQQRQAKDFLLVSQLENSSALHHERAPTALFILGAMITSATLGWLDLLSAGLLSAGAMLLTGCLTISSARKSIDYQVLLVIACAFALGEAIQKTGLAQLIAHWALGLAGGDPLLTLAIVYVVTVLFTETITNNAAAILMFPIALAAATALQVSYMPFVIAVMLAASTSFMTPIGYQTNLMVYGPGGYRFGDYLKVGLPLSVLLGATALMLIPRVWPF